MPAWIHCINCLSLTLFIVACHKSNLGVSFEVQFIVVPQVVEIKKGLMNVSCRETCGNQPRHKMQGRDGVRGELGCF